MQGITCRLTVFFEMPYWVGVVERATDGQMEVCKITFGAEPKDYDVLAYVLENWYSLRFGVSVAASGTRPKAENPKRRQRMAKKEMQQMGVGTRAQQAIQQQREMGKAERKARSRAEREAEAERQYEIRQLKKKEKHRGH